MQMLVLNDSVFEPMILDYDYIYYGALSQVINIVQFNIRWMFVNLVLQSVYIITILHTKSVA